MDILVDMEKESDKLTSRLQELRSKLESMQNQQTEDSRGISKQQKNTERYIAKKQMLLNRKDDCNRNIRDLGVLPEEAFEKYINEKLDRVCLKSFLPSPPRFRTYACCSSSKNSILSTKG